MRDVEGADPNKTTVTPCRGSTKALPYKFSATVAVFSSNSINIDIDLCAVFVYN